MRAETPPFEPITTTSSFLCSQKSIRGGGRIQRKTGAVRQLANRLKRNAGGIKKRLTMTADQVQQMQGGRRRRSASVSSVHSRLGVSRGPRRNSNARLNMNNNNNNTGPRRRLKRSNSVSNLKRSASNGNLARSQSRSNLQRVNSNTNLNRQRNRSRSRNRLNNVTNNNGQQPRRLNRNFKGANLRRVNSKGNLATKARLGINRNNNAINMRRNRRRANAGQSIGTNNQINRQVDVT